MNVEPWLVVAAALFLLGHAVILLFVYRLRQGASLFGGLASSSDDGAATGGVACQECGAENDGEYRFCRECAAELPGGVVPGGSGGEPDSRGML